MEKEPFSGTSNRKEPFSGTNDKGKKKERKRCPFWGLRKRLRKEKRALSRD
jgi:hypothetical protein